MTVQRSAMSCSGGKMLQLNSGEIWLDWCVWQTNSAHAQTGWPLTCCSRGVLEGIPMFWLGQMLGISTLPHICYVPCRSLAASEFSEFLLLDYLNPAPIWPDLIWIYFGPLRTIREGSWNIFYQFYYLHLSSDTDYWYCYPVYASIVLYLLCIGPMTLM